MAGVGQDIKDRLLNTVGDLASDAVRSTLNALYPSEFDLYMISLELTNANDETLDFFTFPINPNSMSKTEPYIKDIDRAFGAIVVNKTGFFAPQDLTIKGNFGKEFKILIREKELSFKALLKKSSNIGLDTPEFSTTIKNGYGCFKVLQNICRRSDELEDGRPRRLYLHNAMLGESYLVEVLDFQGDQNMQSNMIWGYTLRLKIIAPINVSTKNRLASSILGQAQKYITGAVQGIKNVLTSNINY